MGSVIYEKKLWYEMSYETTAVFIYIRLVTVIQYIFLFGNNTILPTFGEMEVHK